MHIVDGELAGSPLSKGNVDVGNSKGSRVVSIAPPVMSATADVISTASRNVPAVACSGKESGSSSRGDICDISAFQSESPLRSCICKIRRAQCGHQSVQSRLSWDV